MVEQVTMADGYYAVPPGKLVNAVTWLEMRACPTQPLAEPLHLEPVAQADKDVCLDLFRRIGLPWLWSRAHAGSDKLGSDVFIAFDAGEEPVGLVEFEGRAGPEVEISYFGLVPEGTGRGLGRRLMTAALAKAWAGSPGRVWLHTCNFDHPSALRFYLSCGFIPCQTGFEIMDDPRLLGMLPRTAGPHVPLIDP